MWVLNSPINISSYFKDESRLQSKCICKILLPWVYIKYRVTKLLAKYFLINPGVEWHLFLCVSLDQAGSWVTFVSLCQPQSSHELSDIYFFVSASIKLRVEWHLFFAPALTKQATNVSVSRNKIKMWMLIFSRWHILCRTMACFERNFHIQISSGDSVLNTTFCRDKVVDTTFLFHDSLWHHNQEWVAGDVLCDIIVGYNIAMGIYHDVTTLMLLGSSFIIYFYTQ